MSIKVKHNDKNVELITQRRLQKIGRKAKLLYDFLTFRKL